MPMVTQLSNSRAGVNWKKVGFKVFGVADPDWMLKKGGARIEKSLIFTVSNDRAQNIVRVFEDSIHSVRSHAR